MLKRSLLTVLFVMLTFILTACFSKENDERATKPIRQKESILFEDKKNGIKIKETKGWSLEEKKETKTMNLVFKNGEIRAVLSEVPGIYTFEDIKKIFLTNIEEDKGKIEEEDGYLRFERGLVEKEVTLFYLVRGGEKQWMVAFIASDEEMKKNTKTIQAFKDNILIEKEGIE